MAARKSQHSLAKMGKVGRQPFLPNLDEWKKACRIYQFDKQIAKYFDISAETFYQFLDRQRCLIEEGKKAAFLEAYKKERTGAHKEISDAFFQNIKNGDNASVIFGMKSYMGFLETKDHKHIELKKIEVAFKTKQFLTDMAKEFNLTYEQLDEFAKKYFKDDKIDDI